MPEIDVITLGCRVNAVESAAMRVAASRAGIGDAVIVNTCAVTAAAVRDATKAIRRVRRSRPDARIIVTGCAAQIEPERFAAMAEVDHVIGNAEKTNPETFAALSIEEAPRVAVNDIMELGETASHMIASYDGRTRAFVHVQNGCDHRCTFCVIPFGRGPSRSVAAGAVVAEVRRLVDSGVAEAVLTGVDLTSYGRDLPGAMTLGKLVRSILKHVPELQRLRLSSIDQVEVDPDLMAAIADEPRFMPHLHLSMQSGDDMILKRMKRRHSRREAIAFCSEVRRLRPDVVFGADLIAGFPTETEAMFEKTIALIDDCGLTFLHVFPYSRRQGTPAARMPQVRGPDIVDRAARLRAEGAARVSAFLRSQVGLTLDVLAERGGKGRTPQFAEVTFAFAPPSPGLVVKAHIVGAEPPTLHGEAPA